MSHNLLETVSPDAPSHLMEHLAFETYDDVPVCFIFHAGTTPQGSEQSEEIDSTVYLAHSYSSIRFHSSIRYSLIKCAQLALLVGFVFLRVRTRHDEL